MSSARLSRRGRTRVRIRPTVDDSQRFIDNDRQHSPSTPSPQLAGGSLQSSLMPMKEHSRKRNLKEKYHIDDLELKNTLGRCL